MKIDNFSRFSWIYETILLKIYKPSILLIDKTGEVL